MKVSPGTFILGIFAVLFGLVGAYYVKAYLQQEQPVATPEPAQPRVVPMAAADLVPDRTIMLGDVALASMTSEQIGKSGIPRGFMTDPAQIIGRTLREPMTKGEAFQPTVFYPEGMGPSVAERLGPGNRAITIPLENSPAELALVSPGMMVDIVFRADEIEEEYIPETTVTLLERVEVLAIGEETFVGSRAAATRDGRTRGKVTVTLAVSPEQANALKIVEGHGIMSLVVRGTKDEMLVGNVGPQTLAGLLDLPEPEPPFTTQIYRRGRLTTTVFEKGQPTVVAEALNGLPVAADAPRATVRTVSQTVTKKTNTEKAAPCGCGGE